jgi:RNA polymerase sigma-70 factor (ECF subfamily)
MIAQWGAFAPSTSLPINWQLAEMPTGPLVNWRSVTPNCQSFQSHKTEISWHGDCLHPVEQAEASYRGGQGTMTGDTFEALLAPNLQSVRRFVQARLRASDHADDVMQQTLLSAFAHRHQLSASSKFKSWLCSIAMNEVRMFFRSDRGHLSLDEFPNIDARDTDPSPQARLEQMERFEWLQAGMAKLSERDRTAIRLRDLDELSLTETAAAFRSSEAAAKSAHFRARRRLAGAIRGSRVTRQADRRRTADRTAIIDRKVKYQRLSESTGASALGTPMRVGQ